MPEVVSGQADGDWFDWEMGVERMEENERMGLVLISKEGCTLTDHYLNTSLDEPKVEALMLKRFVPIRIKNQQALQSKGTIQSLLSKPSSLPADLSKLIQKESLRSPTLVILDKNLKVLQSFSGYINAHRLALILEYFGLDHYKKTPWDKFQKGVN